MVLTVDPSARLLHSRSLCAHIHTVALTVHHVALSIHTVALTVRLAHTSAGAGVPRDGGRPAGGVRDV
eukprot:2308380-Pyramimonas_sp.AAC.1